jgi:hypothetical protein
VLIDVDPESRFSLLDLAGVHLIIEDSMGLSKQVSLRRSINAAMASRVADDLIQVF